MYVIVNESAADCGVNRLKMRKLMVQRDNEEELNNYPALHLTRNLRTCFVVSELIIASLAVEARLTIP